MSVIFDVTDFSIWPIPTLIIYVPAAPCPRLPPPPLLLRWKLEGSGWTPRPAGGAADTGCPAGAGSAGSWHTIINTC